MTELTIQINNDSIILSLKRILKAISGIVSVKTTKKTAKPILYDLETNRELNDKTMQLIENVKAGKEELASFDNVDDLMKDLCS